MQTRAKVKDKKVYYMLKFLNIKNIIIIKKKSKYLIFNFLCLHLSKDYYNFLYRKN